MNRLESIVEHFNQYENVVNSAKENKYISTKNFVGDIIEELVCEVIGASRDEVPSSAKGFDAIKEGRLVQIKFRSPNKKGKFKIRFKNLSDNKVGFQVLALCIRNENGFKIYEIEVNELNLRSVPNKNMAVITLLANELEQLSIQNYDV